MVQTTKHLLRFVLSAVKLLAIRWIIEYARDRSGNSMGEKLAAELIDAAHKRGGAIKKREDVHRMADANKAFATLGGRFPR